MGAAASIEGEKQRMNQSPMRHGAANSSRVSTRSVNSVRAMALMNHSRQENSYISQNGLNERLKTSLRTIDGNKDERRFQPKKKGGTEEMPKMQTPTLAEVARESSASSMNSSGSAIGEVPRAPSNVGLITMRSNMNFNLKIEVQEETDWVQISDDEDPDPMHLSKYDSNLIEVPVDEHTDAASKGDSSAKEGNNMQYRQDGTFFVNGLNAGVGAEGIIRPNMGPMGRKLPMRERIVMLCRLGQGASSAVYKALDLTDLRLVALKMIHVTDKDKRDQMVRELKALFSLLRENSRRSSIHLPKKFRRPEKYIVDFYDAFSNLEDGIVSLMIEYMDGGSLQDIADQGGCTDEPTLANIAVQALKGLAFLHEGNQIHRDLKPGNFLISHRGEVKVADLGIVKQLQVCKKGTLQRANTYVGTAVYMSPERIDGKDYSFPSDVWAFGLSLITIAEGALPVDTAGGYWSVLKSIKDSPPPNVGSTFSKEFRDFISQCMKRNADERMTVKQLIRHPFLRNTFAEDLTYNQSYERGKDELLSIIKAMFAHVMQLKEDSAENSLNCQQSEKLTPLRERLFGDIERWSAKDILRKLLFNEEPADADSSGADGVRQRFNKPRLQTLAKQLHLPVDKAEQEARDYVNSFRDD